MRRSVSSVYNYRPPLPRFRERKVCTYRMRAVRLGSVLEASGGGGGFSLWSITSNYFCTVPPWLLTRARAAFLGPSKGPRGKTEVEIGAEGAPRPSPSIAKKSRAAEDTRLLIYPRRNSRNSPPDSGTGTTRIPRNSRHLLTSLGFVYLF